MLDRGFSILVGGNRRSGDKGGEDGVIPSLFSQPLHPEHR